MKKFLIRLPILLIPFLFVFLGIFYKDNTYFSIAFISLFISFLVLFPKAFSKRTVSLPKLNRGASRISHLGIKDLGVFKFRDLFGLRMKVFITLTVLYSVLFSVSAIFILQYKSTNNNFWLSYFLNQYYFVLDRKIAVYFMVIIVLVIVFAVLYVRKNKYLHTLFRKIVTSLIISFGSFVLGLFISLILTLIIGFCQVNVSAVSISVNFRGTGIITNTDQVITKLKAMDKAPIIVPYKESDKNKLLATLINPNTGTNNYYLRVIIPSIPTFLTLPLNLPSKSIFLIGNVLVVRSINPNDIQPISPYIGYLLVKGYFGSRFIKSYPNVLVMGRQEYLNYRIDQYNQIIAKVNIAIQAIIKEISGYYGRIQTDRNNIAGWQNQINTANSYKTSSYNNCISSGYYDYYSGAFINYYSQSYCQGLGSQYDSYITQANQGIASNNQDINLTNGYITQDQGYESELKGYVGVLEADKTQTPQELGIFEADNNIKVAVDETGTNTIVDYFETLSHEYLHYASYVNKDQGLSSSFFEEGLTETFARRVVKKEFGVNTHTGYPVLVALMSEMMKKIPEATLEEIYFSKDESSLEAALANAYGEKFYKDFSNYFDIIGYLPDREALSIANSMLLRMGSKPLQESDLYSSPDTSN